MLTFHSTRNSTDSFIPKRHLALLRLNTDNLNAFLHIGEKLQFGFSYEYIFLNNPLKIKKKIRSSKSNYFQIFSIIFSHLPDCVEYQKGILFIMTFYAILRLNHSLPNCYLDVSTQRNFSTYQQNFRSKQNL